MKTLKRNQSKFWYCLYQGTEELRDDSLNESGDERVIYSRPVLMTANVSPATGASVTEQFGNLENYDKVIVTEQVNCPIDEHSVLFVDKVPEYDPAQNPIYDYVVRRVARSLNSVSIAIRKVDVS